MLNQSCSVVCKVLLVLLLLFPRFDTIRRAENTILKRSKRLTSPNLDSDTKIAAKYVVSIRSNMPQIRFGDNHYCIGSIVAPTFVLTAAMCTMSSFMVPHETRSIVVIGGTPNRLIHIENTVERRVKKVLVSKNFTKNFRNNIALLKLNKSWPTNNPNIAIVKMPTEAVNYDMEYMVLGWGRMFKGGPLSGNLVHIRVSLLAHELCEKILKIVQPEILCAGNFAEGGDSSPCAGDTGAPMMNNGTLVAIVSDRLGCGSKAMPSLYTDVWYHLEWINNMLQKTAAKATTKYTHCIPLYLLSLISVALKYIY
ncbi:trypsin I-P1 isoform X1 [Drosophila hydei]|uniref:trypsin n=1 Tax=Drosophila hydei TaxID=7224 RepID=A0A6J1MFQ3_DROHY|nr:trypsin I-P1 isoform X1 [Drosophila hydei]